MKRIHQQIVNALYDSGTIDIIWAVALYFIVCGLAIQLVSFFL